MLDSGMYNTYVMKLIKPSFEILEQKSGLQGIYDQIALCASTCYKSNPKTGNDAKAFVDKLKENNHTAMLEFGTVYLNMPITTHYSGDIGYYRNPYSIISESNGYPFKDKFGDSVDCYCITTNLRAMLEHVPSIAGDLREFITEPTDFHEKRICVKFITSIGVARELTRHRKFSFAQESTRYVNYSKDKFGSELTFVIPYWLNIPEGSAYWHDGICYRVGATDDNYFGISVNYHNFDNWETCSTFLKPLENAESSYMKLIRTGVKAQEAREVLPLCTKTEIYMCGFVKDWEHFFKLRALDKTGPAHPDMKAISVPLYEEFIKRGYINELD